MKTWNLEKYPNSEKCFEMVRGDILHIPPILIHQFYGLEDSEILEVSTQHFEDDSYRLEKGD